MLLGFLMFQLMPDKLLGIFSPSEHMLSIGVPALRRISISFLFAELCGFELEALFFGLLEACA